MLAVDVPSKLPSVGVPELYLRATEDRVVPVEASRHICENPPGLEIVPIEAPQFLLQAAPRQAAVAVKAFADALQTAG